MAACISPKGEWIYCVGEDRYVYIMLMLDLSLYFLKFLIGKLVLFISSLPYICSSCHTDYTLSPNIGLPEVP